MSEWSILALCTLALVLLFGVGYVGNKRMAREDDTRDRCIAAGHVWACDSCIPVKK